MRKLGGKSARAITIDAQDWDERADKMIRALGGMTSQGFQKAAVRAVRKTARWVQTHASRAVAKDSGLPVGAFKRMRVRVHVGGSKVDGVTEFEGKVWIGTNPFPAHHIGKVKWTRRMRGARAGRRQFPGSFSWGPHGGKPPIFHRRSSASDAKVEVTSVAVDEAAQEQARRIERRALSRFRRVLEQELNYEMSKRFG